MFIDLKTLFIVYVVYSFLGILVMYSLWSQYRKRFPETTLWLADYIMQFTALLLVTLRGKIPDLLSIVSANSLIIWGTIILYKGLGQYAGIKTRLTHNYIMLFVFTSVHAYLTYMHPSLALRNVNLSAALIYICSQGAWLMLRRVHEDLKPAARTTGIILLLFCVINSVHIIDNFAAPKNGDLFLSGNLNAVVILTDETLFIALTFALFLLVSRRLQIALENELVEHNRAEEDLRRSEEKFSKAFQTSPYAIAITRLEDGRFIEVNDAFVHKTGYSREELSRESSIGLRLWVDRKEREKMVAAVMKGSPVSGQEFSFRNKKGDTLTGLLFTQIIILQEGPCILSSIDDITERKKAEEQIRHMANHDALTDLPTMRLARDRLSSALSSARRHKNKMAVMFIDLDGFKSVNDTLGHDAGDQVLKQVAVRMLSCVRETDTVARAGGDEFLVIATDLHSRDDAAQIAQKIISLVAQPLTINGSRTGVGASIGIALYPDYDEDMDRLVKRADEAMYRVKNSGKNGFLFA